MFGKVGFMLNKKEQQQTEEFISLLVDNARELLDSVAEYEAILAMNKAQQRAESAERAKRKKRSKRARIAS